MVKTGLVLEGGGMRGAYTAGACAWLVDNDVAFDYSVGISSGAIHMCSYLMKNKKYLYDISVNYMSDKKNVGLDPLFHEGRWVGYKYMFYDLLKKQVKFDTSSIRDGDYKIEMGVFDCLTGETIFYDKSALDDNLTFLLATCTLPIAGNIVDYEGHKYLDGGIRIMIPMQQALDNGCDRTLVIATKPEGYVRKAAGWAMRTFMKLNFLKYPNVYKQYNMRAERYNEQMALIEDKCEKGESILIRPSINIPVKRFSGDPENLKKLFELGYSDMEKNKDRIYALLKKD